MERPWWAWGCHDQMTPEDLRNHGRLNLAVLSWLAVFALAVILVRKDVVTGRPWDVLVAISPIPVSLWVLHRYRRFLAQTDELNRKIHLEAAALAFGGGIVLMFGWTLLESVGAPRMGATEPVVPMVAIYAIAQSLATRRYR